MNLHDHLRDLVARQGPSVVDSAESFRAALDDFLSEDEATTGELNLLVDAVRLGAVNGWARSWTMAARPAPRWRRPATASLAIAAPTTCPGAGGRSAVVGYALGRIEVGDIPPLDPSGSVPAPPPAPPPVSSPAPPPSPPSTSQPPRTFPQTEAVSWPPAPPPSAPTSPPRRRGGGRIGLVVVLTGAVIAAAVGIGMWLGSRNDEPNRAGADPSGEPTADERPSDSGASSGAAIPANSAVLPVTDDTGASRIYAIDVDTGEAQPLTEGPNDRVPSVSPDRSILMYVQNSAEGVAQPMVLDLTSGKTRALLTDASPCDYGGRPGFSPSGDRVVLVCFDGSGDYTATYVLDLQGREVGVVPAAEDPMGTPTWISEGALVYSLAGATEDLPTTLWEAEVDGEARQITDGSLGWDTHPDWEADAGEAGLLLFSRHAGKQVFGDVLTMDADGNPGPFTEGVLWGHPAWSPDGTRVLFTERDADGVERLAWAPLDDLTEVNYVPEIDGEPGIPAWGTR